MFFLEGWLPPLDMFSTVGPENQQATDASFVVDTQLILRPDTGITKRLHHQETAKPVNRITLFCFCHVLSSQSTHTLTKLIIITPLVCVQNNKDKVDKSLQHADLNTIFSVMIGEKLNTLTVKA